MRRDHSHVSPAPTDAIFPVAIDWRDDALIAERNAAKAEAELWQRRALNMQKQLDQIRAEL